MKSAIRFALLALVLVIVAMVSALTAMRFAIHGQEVAVPPLVGLDPVEAERKVAGLGLQISIERQYYSPQIPEGKIMSQLPLPGTKVRRGWQVRVAQSLGPTRVTIPDVTGESEHAAELNIRRRGLDVVSMAQVQALDIPADQVAGTESDGERNAGGGTEDQLAGDGASGSTSVRDAELCGTGAGEREPDIGRCGIQARQCECGSAGQFGFGGRGESEYLDRAGIAWGHSSSSVADHASGPGFACEHYGFAIAGSGAEGVCGYSRELRGAVNCLPMDVHALVD